MLGLTSRYTLTSPYLIFGTLFQTSLDSFGSDVIPVSRTISNMLTA